MVLRYVWVAQVPVQYVHEGLQQPKPPPQSCNTFYASNEANVIMGAVATPSMALSVLTERFSPG